MATTLAIACDGGLMTTPRRTTLATSGKAATSSSGVFVFGRTPICGRGLVHPIRRSVRALLHWERAILFDFEVDPAIE